MPLEMSINFTSSGLLKLHPDFKQISNEILDGVGLDCEREMKQPGIGTRGGNMTPTGGAPVDTGLLRNSITSQPAQNQIKFIRTPNVEYSGYVIDGTSKQAPNNFPKRAVDKVMTGDSIRTYTDKALRKHKLI